MTRILERVRGLLAMTLSEISIRRFFACCRLLANAAGRAVTFLPSARSRSSKARNCAIAGSVCCWLRA